MNQGNEISNNVVEKLSKNDDAFQKLSSYLLQKKNSRTQLLQNSQSERTLIPKSSVNMTLKRQILDIQKTKDLIEPTTPNNYKSNKVLLSKI